MLMRIQTSLVDIVAVGLKSAYAYAYTSNNEPVESDTERIFRMVNGNQADTICLHGCVNEHQTKQRKKELMMTK